MGNLKDALHGPLPCGKVTVVKRPVVEDLSTFGGRFAAAMDAVPMKGTALAGATGVDQGYISRLRNGERQMPNADIVERFARALGVQGAWLAQGIGPRLRHETESAELHALDAVLEEPGWAGAAGLSLEQAQAVVLDLHALRTASNAGLPRSVWRDERDKAVNRALGRDLKVHQREPGAPPPDPDAPSPELIELKKRRAGAKGKGKLR